MAKIVGGLATVSTIAAAGGYAMEKWNETKATVDFVGEIDQKKPFTVPLSIKNPSSIFSIHSVVMSCDVTAYYSDKDTHRLSLVGGQLPTSGAIQISPGEVQNYWCDYPDKMIYTATETGTVIPLESAVMTVHLSYETWIPWAITRDLTFEFTLFVTTGGMRWVKGKWVR